MLYLDADDVEDCLNDREILEIVEETMRGAGGSGAQNGPKAGFGLDVEGGRLHFGSVSGLSEPGGAAGVKWFTVADNNPSLGFPRVPAYILLTDAQTGLLKGVLDGTRLTPVRTAAMALVGVNACRARPQTVTIIGAGAIGFSLLRLLAQQARVERIRIVARQESAARDACAYVRRSVRSACVLEPCTNAEDAVHGADVVFTATAVPVDSDLVRAAWLKPDAVVCSLGSRREVDHDLIRTAWIALDDPDGVAMRRPDFREGGVGAARGAAKLCDIVGGRVAVPKIGRVFLIIGGLGVIDVALGARALRNAELRAKGIQLAK
ncbi:ornithine cyclodeaminase/alanine dehydrogenase-like protein (mu-crystallin family) [Bradyrhizobium sp. USDA 4516]